MMWLKRRASGMEGAWVGRKSSGGGYTGLESQRSERGEEGNRESGGGLRRP